MNAPTGFRLPARLAGLSDDHKAGLQARAAVACARMGIGLGDAATPGELAVRLSRGRVVQRPHLVVLDSAFVKALNREEMHGRVVDRIGIVTPPQVGKPIACSAMILMSDGSRRPLGEINVGDHVITHTGRAQRVTAVHEQGALPVLRITTYAGRSTVAAYDHPFLTPEGWVNAGDLVVGQALATVPRPQTHPTSTLTAPAARLLGYFVGDGSTSGRNRNDGSCNAGITTVSPAVAERAGACAETLGFTYRTKRYSSSRASVLEFSGGVRAWLREHGLARETSRTKRVPAAVFTAPLEVVAEFIAGYWDCDGAVSSRGKARDGSERPDVACELYSVSRDLLLDVQHLLLRLGIRCQIRTKIGTYKDAEHVSYRLSLIRRDDVARFREMITLEHEKRAERLTAHPFLRVDFDAPLLADPIVAIEPAGTQECRCLTVAEDHTFTADDLVVHNSERGAVAAPYWWLTHRPRDRIVLVSYADPLAVRRGRDVRKLVREHGLAYGLELERGSKSARDWQLASGGGMRCAGIGGSITGMPADLGIIDDPHKNRAEADSEEMREKVWDFYSGDFYSRLAPGAPIILIQTRWHRDDLMGRLIKKEGRIEDGGRWLILHMPALANPSRYGPDLLGRSYGDPLPHPRLSVHDVAGALAHWNDKRNGSSARDWAALYQGDPIPTEGALTTEAILERQRVPAMPCDAAVVAVAIDPSGEGRDVAGVVAGALGEDGHLYWTHDRSGEMPVAVWARTACELAAELDADRVIYESNYGKGMIRYALKTAWAALRDEWIAENAGPQPRAGTTQYEAWARIVAGCPYGEAMPRLVEQVSKRGKWLRAEPVAQQLSEGRVWLVGALPDLETEWLEWQPTSKESPGRIDASVHLTLGLLRPPGTDAVISTPTGRGASGASPIHRRRLR